MEKQNSFHFAVIGILTLAVLFMSVGFATFSQSLDINGSSVRGTKQFDISLDATSYQLGEGSVKPSSSTITDDRLDFTMTFHERGEYFLASLNVQNFGDLDGVIDTVRMPSYDPAKGDFIKYTILYDNDEILVGSQEELNYVINSAVGSNIKTMVVKAVFEPSENYVIPAEGVETTIFAEFEFVQTV